MIDLPKINRQMLYSQSPAARPWRYNNLITAPVRRVQDMQISCLCGTAQTVRIKQHTKQNKKIK